MKTPESLDNGFESKPNRSELALEIALREDFQHAVYNAPTKIAAISTVRELLAVHYPDLFSKTSPTEDIEKQNQLIRSDNPLGGHPSDQFKIAKDIVELILADKEK